MDLIAIAGVGLIATAAAVLLKQYKPEYAMLVSLMAVGVMFFWILGEFFPALSTLRGMMERTAFSSQALRTLMKCLGVCYLCEIAGQVCREDAVRRLAQLAFGRVNDAARLALHSGEADLEALDLSAVAELKVTDKGGVEIKLIDRIRALEVLCGLLGEEKAEGAGELYRVLADAAGEEGAWDDG